MVNFYDQWALSCLLRRMSKARRVLSTITPQPNLSNTRAMPLDRRRSEAGDDTDMAVSCGQPTVPTVPPSPGMEAGGASTPTVLSKRVPPSPGVEAGGASTPTVLSKRMRTLHTGAASTRVKETTTLQARVNDFTSKMMVMPKAKRDRDDNPYDSWELNEIRSKAKTDNKAGQYAVTQRRELLDCLQGEWSTINQLFDDDKCLEFGAKAMRIIESDTDHLGNLERVRLVASDLVIQNECDWLKTLTSAENKIFVRNAFCSDLEARDKKAVLLVKDLFKEIRVKTGPRAPDLCKELEHDVLMDLEHRKDLENKTALDLKGAENAALKKDIDHKDAEHAALQAELDACKDMLKQRAEVVELFKHTKVPGCDNCPRLLGQNQHDISGPSRFRNSLYQMECGFAFCLDCKKKPDVRTEKCQKAGCEHGVEYALTTAMFLDELVATRAHALKKYPHNVIDFGDEYEDAPEFLVNYRDTQNKIRKGDYSRDLLTLP